VEANSTGGHGPHRAVEPSDDDLGYILNFSEHCGFTNALNTHMDLITCHTRLGKHILHDAGTKCIYLHNKVSCFDAVQQNSMY
jgi:hypothetical protein